METGLHHYHHRHNQVKEALVRLENLRPAVRILDRFILVLAFIGPLLTLPQVYGVWVERQVAGLSLLSWGGYAVLSLIWLTYGIVHHARPLIVSYSIFAVLNTAVAIGVLLFK